MCTIRFFNFILKEMRGIHNEFKLLYYTSSDTQFKWKK